MVINMADELAEVRVALKNDKVVIGTERVLKGVRAGSVAKVFLSSNAPDEVRDDILRYAETAKIPVVDLDVPNDELGVICKKKFHISVLATI